jgi:hypothetical protein
VCGAASETVVSRVPSDQETDAKTVPSPSTVTRPIKRQVLGGCEIYEELGRGGMGVVYRARQIGLDRIVALKMVLAGPGSEGEELERFRIEAAAVARFQHPNIVQIHEIGEEGGRPFFCLEYLDGGNLARKISGKPQPPRHAATLLQTLAAAVQHAHERDIVHRDLKPANILLNRDGTPKISDFGLAKHLHADSARTRTGAILGTPSYMAPEQAAGMTKEIGPATDIYALGAILYELLTGRPPFRGASVWQTLEMVRAQPPVPPRRLQPTLPRDLEIIVLKCLEKEPHRRYPTAAALADDLGRWLRGETVTAQPPSLHDRFVRFTRRHRAVAAVSVAALVGLVGLAVGREIWLRRQADELRIQVTQLRQQAYQQTVLHRESEAMTLLKEALVRLESVPRLADLRAEVQREAASLEAPLAARERFARFYRTLSRVFEQQPKVRRDSTGIEQNSRFIKLCEDALAEYQVLERANWYENSELSWHSPEEVVRLKEDVDALLTVYADSQWESKTLGACMTGLGLQLDSGAASGRQVARVLFEIVPDGPAAKAGIRLDDKILEVDGVSTRTFANNNELVARLKGLPGTPVRLMILSTNEVDPKEIVVHRSEAGTVGFGVAQIGQLRVVHVEPGGAAAQAGVVPGDLLLSINGQPAEGEATVIRGKLETSPWASVYNLINSQPSSEITLLVLPAKDRVPRVVPVLWDSSRSGTLRRAHTLVLAGNVRKIRGAFESALTARDPELLRMLHIEKPEGKLEDHIVRYYVAEFLWPADLVAQAVAESASAFPLYQDALRLQAQFTPAAYRSAIAKLQAQLQVTPSHAPSWSVLAFCRSELKQWDEAISTWTAYIALRPHAAIGYHRRGLAFREVGQVESAKQDLRRALELNPDYDEARTALDGLEKTATRSR